MYKIVVPGYWSLDAKIDAGALTPLDSFVLSNQPTGQEYPEKWRMELQNLIDYIVEEQQWINEYQSADVHICKECGQDKRPKPILFP